MQDLILSWSGGKDSSYCLYQLLQDGEYNIKRLFCHINAQSKRVGMHGVPKSLILQQAKALQLPIDFIEIPEDASHDAYEEHMLNYFKTVAKEGITTIAYGDIFLEDLRMYREAMAAEAGLEVEFPLWGMDTEILFRTFIAQGFETVICSANADYFSKEAAGKVISLTMLEQIKKKNIDICGENGEFHTFCFNGPIFKEKVKFFCENVVSKEYSYTISENDKKKEVQQSFWFADLRSA